MLFCFGCNITGIALCQEMSKATKRKHVMLEILQDDFSPPAANQQIVKILNSRGNNLHEVEAADKSKFLVSMPNKFRKNVWVKRGDFVIVEPIEEGDKVKAEIVRIVTKEHIKLFKKDHLWPKEFDDNQDDEIESSDDDILFVNTNRPNVDDSDESDTSSHSDQNASDALVSSEEEKKSKK